MSSGPAPKAARRAVVCSAVRIEASEVDAVPEQVQLACRNAQLPQHVDVLHVLEELRVRARGGHAFERVEDHPLRERVLGEHVQPVDGVHDGGDACHPRGQPPVEAGLRVVRVHEVRCQPAEEPAQLEQGLDVRTRGHGPGRVRQRLVTDAPARELLDVRARGRRADHLVAGGGERPELWPQQQRQADVGARDVDDPRPPPPDGVAHDSAPE
jgi:hypothetical protein